MNRLRLNLSSAMTELDGADSLIYMKQRITNFFAGSAVYRSFVFPNRSLSLLIHMNTFSDWLHSDSSQKRAIAYYRHSAEDKQENSVPIQREHAQKFARDHNIEIIHEEADEGKTGLLADRPGFMNIFRHWIENSEAPSFQYVLVYDVSRWGRFQDQNEPAHYEFRCTLHGKKVIYIEDGFPKEDQQLYGSLLTSMKRFTAAEFSRQLSGKVFYGCMKVSEQGYSAGGAPCYGMTRELLDENKNPICFLKKGEHKQISNQRVRFVPLNDETTQVVRDIFHFFVNEKLTLSQVATVLNEHGIPSTCGGLWNRDKIIRVLMNETYTGTRIYNKTWNRLREGKRNNPRSDWVICLDAFPAIINRELFEKAQQQLWVSLRKWRENNWSMRRIKALFMKATRNLLLRKSFNEDEIFLICHNFPLLLSVSKQVTGGPREWCFLLPEEMGAHEFAIGIGVVPDRSNPADHIFLIPIENFGVGGVCTFSEKDELYTQCMATASQLEEKILTLAGVIFKSTCEITRETTAMTC